MRFGKIRVENNQLIFSRRMRMTSLPSSEIVLACRESERTENRLPLQAEDRVSVITKQNKKYEFPMSVGEAEDLLDYLKDAAPSAEIGFPYKRRILFQSLPNARDLGGIRNREGRIIRPKRLLRSGELYHISRLDQQILSEEYGIKTVIDLRTPGEKKKKPDTFLEGVCYIENSVLDEMTAKADAEKGMTNFIDKIGDCPETYLQSLYRDSVLDPYSVNKYAEFLDYLADCRDGAVLWHSALGKDRAGIGTALLLYVLNVPRDIILEDYLSTNRFLEEEAEYLIRFFGTEKEGKKKQEVIRILYGARREYLEEVFRIVEQTYGSMEVFMKKKLYVTPRMAEELQKNYLV